MNSNIIQHLFRSVRHHFALQFMTILVLSLVLLALSLVFGLRENLAQVNELWGDNLELTIYLKDNAPADAVDTFVQGLKVEHGSDRVRLIKKDEALKQFLSRMGSSAPELVRSPEFDNPLPQSVEIKIKGDLSAKARVEQLKALASRFRGAELVEDVSYGQGWIENWAGFLTSVNVLSAAAVAITMLLGLLVIGNSVRVSLSQRRDEIEILELVGATTRWIRMPYIIEGAVLGFVASLLAAASGFFLQTLLCSYLKSGLSFWSVTQELQPLSLTGWGAIVLIGTAFGAVGALVCIRHLNSGWSAAERWNQA